MFAIALWDRQRRRLFLARDRLGEKPLYYGWLGGVLVFGSELKALAAHPMWSGEIDRTALALYLRHAYVPAPFSAYREVRKLPPGHFLVIEAGGQPAAPTAYWAAPARFAAVEPFAGTADEAAERLAELVRRSVGLRMLADVPVGMFLSGGIDSSTVAAAMQAQAAGRVHTYSIGFAEQRYDESAHAAAVARALGTEHTELRVGDAECRAVVPRLAAIYDEPFADASQIPTLVLSELTRRHVTVALSGDGGDELFGGYPRYRLAARRWQRHAALPAPLRRAARAFVDVGGPQALTRALGRPGRKLARAIEDLGAASPERLYRNMVSLWRDADGLTRRPPASPFDGGLALPDGCGPEQRLMFLDALTYLPDDLLVKVDRASMAASLEARAPLLDHKIVEFAWSLPGSICFHDGAGKWPLRQVLYQAVPRALVDRPKQGFEPPLGDWLRGPLRDWAEALLSPRALAADGLVEPGPVRARWREHLSGRRNRAYALWVILMLQAWRAKPLRP
jgi:asparagine synthase (glutamine-hydrolysing)